MDYPYRYHTLGYLLRSTILSIRLLSRRRKLMKPFGWTILHLLALVVLPRRLSIPTQAYTLVTSK
jgi:hypothetical protein